MRGRSDHDCQSPVTTAVDVGGTTQTTKRRVQVGLKLLPNIGMTRCRRTRDSDTGPTAASRNNAENTVRFYQGRGARLLPNPDVELFAKEPEDIHFECPV